MREKLREKFVSAIENIVVEECAYQSDPSAWLSKNSFFLLEEIQNSGAKAIRNVMKMMKKF